MVAQGTTPPGRPLDTLFGSDANADDVHALCRFLHRLNAIGIDNGDDTIALCDGFAAMLAENSAELIDHSVDQLLEALRLRVSDNDLSAFYDGQRIALFEINNETPLTAWPTKEALAIDVAAAQALSNFDPWDEKSTSTQLRILEITRVLLPTCPFCGGATQCPNDDATDDGPLVMLTCPTCNLLLAAVPKLGEN